MVLRTATLLAMLMSLGAVTALAQGVGLTDGGIQFPDGTVQETSAVVPDGPAAVTVAVDCGAGDSIMEALQAPARVLTIEISGICNEVVITSRPRVIFRGTDPMTDGIDATGVTAALSNPLNLLGTWGVDVENLKLTGGVGGLSVDYSFSIDVINSRLEGNSLTGAFVALGSSLVRFTDTVSTGNGWGVFVNTGSDLTCTRCTIDNNTSRGIRCEQGSSVSLVDSTVEGTRAIDAFGCAIGASGGTLEAVADGGGFGLAIEATEHTSVSLSGTSVVGPIWALVGSTAEWLDVTQTAAAGATTSNFLSADSSLVAGSTTSLAGDMTLEEFSNAVIAVDASMSGNLSCASGADTFCADPGDVTGTSSCTQCPKP